MGRSKGPEKTPQLVDHVADSSDEEIDEDLAFNSDDERLYGTFFVNSNRKQSSSNTKHSKRKRGSNDGDSDDESEVYDDDDDSKTSDSDDGIASDDEAGDGGQFMLDLLNNLDKKEKDEKEEEQEIRSTLKHTSMIPESQFSATALKSSSLTLDQLMNGISDTKGYTSVKRAMKDMTAEIYENDSMSKLSTTKAPVAKVISERAERKVNYEDQSRNVSDWTRVVKQNREAETLDFRPKDRIKINKADLVQKFEPTTDFEKEIAAALEEEGAVAANEEDIMQREECAMFGDGGNDGFDDADNDDLGMNKLSPEEYKKRMGELSKMRALMFYEEQKRHHINKIKSKKYRKIRKKQRLRNKEEEEEETAENDKDFAKELEEKAEMERMKERMSLKHRNTSKWAKRVLRRGGNIDMETRKALSEQIRMGDELKKKIEGQFGDSDDDGEFDLIAQAKNILQETEKDEKKGTEDKGLFKLAFMKKGIESQRERAKEEARELLKELEANENDDVNDLNDSDREDTEANDKHKKNQVASAKEMEGVLSKGKLVAESLTFGTLNSIQVSGDIDLNSNSTLSTKTRTRDTKTISLTTVEVEEIGACSALSKPKASTLKKTGVKSKSIAEEESNPWLARGTGGHDNGTNQDGDKKRRKKNGPAISKQGIVNVADAVRIISNDNDERVAGKATEKKDSEGGTSGDKIASLSQDELVKKAFATPSEKEIEEEFEQEKEKMRTRDDYSKKEDDSKVVCGWGSWAGEGAPLPKPPRKLPKKMAPPQKKIKARKRQDDGKKHVIINAKRIKKTAKFQLENIPYPFSSREQYERAMGGAIGKEWNVSSAVKNMTRAEVLTRAGKMIKPINKKSKTKRAPAKF